MAEARVGEISPVGKGSDDEEEINVSSASKESEDDRDDTSADLHCDDSECTEGNTRSAQSGSAVAISKNKEFRSDSASQGGTGSEGEIREQRDLTSGGNCHSTFALNGEENKENLCIAVVPEQTLTDPSASSETEEGDSKRPNPALERADPLKIAADAPVSQTTRSEEEEWVRQVQADGRVSVVFPGSVKQDACCRFVCEILKCVLYLRQQLPMTYDQLVLFHRKQQALSRSEEVVGRRPVKPGGWDLRKSQRTLQELEEVLAHLEAPPRVLRTSVCLRQLFRRLFLADFLSDARPVRLLATSVLALAHRDCGVAWFRPRLDYREPTRPKRRIIALSCDPSVTGPPQSGPADVISDDYIWFQAPVAIKGFCK
ncbi:hypothetical protein GJAV_G00244030 [Gymnothorax javanicus]|nr:hypothetical protein GJAV_G00244030 [Gymnothorax javanicus]